MTVGVHISNPFVEVGSDENSVVKYFFTTTAGRINLSQSARRTQSGFGWASLIYPWESVQFVAENCRMFQFV